MSRKSKGAPRIAFQINSRKIQPSALRLPAQSSATTSAFRLPAVSSQPVEEPISPNVEAPANPSDVQTISPVVPAAEKERPEPAATKHDMSQHSSRRSREPEKSHRGDDGHRNDREHDRREAYRREEYRDDDARDGYRDRRSRDNERDYRDDYDDRYRRDYSRRDDGRGRHNDRHRRYDSERERRYADDDDDDRYSSRRYRDDRYDRYDGYGRDRYDGYDRDDRRDRYRRDGRGSDRDDDRYTNRSYRSEGHSSRYYDDDDRDDRRGYRRRNDDRTRDRAHESVSPPRKRDKVAAARAPRVKTDAALEVFQKFKQQHEEPSDISPSNSNVSPSTNEIEEPPPPKSPTPEPEPEPEPVRVWLSGPVDQFVDRQEIGQGTYGKVYRATHQDDGSKVALKMIKMENEREGFPLTALREIKILRLLQHPAIVNLRGIVTDLKQNKDLLSKGLASFFLVFEYMEHDMTGLLESGLTDLDEEQIRSLMKQLMQGVEYCHKRGFLHRDIKGSNLLVNNRCELKIADFGLARRYENRERGYTNKVITLWYRPPELLLGATRYGPAVDVWSTGCILGELFLRKQLFRGSNEIQQLLLICQTCGNPTQATWDKLTSLPNYDTVMPKKRFDRNMQKPFLEAKVDVPPLALDLLDRMLTLNPTKRPTASECLQHAYLRPATKAKPLQLTRDQDCHEMWSKAQRNQSAAQQAQA